MPGKLFDPNMHYAVHEQPPLADTEHVKRRCLMSAMLIFPNLKNWTSIYLMMGVVHFL